MEIEYFKKIANKKISDYVSAHYEKIKVLPGICRYNFRCHDNAMHDAIENKDDCTALCIYFEDGTPILHSVNYHKGKYIDNTLGHFSREIEYYLVRYIHQEEFWKVGHVPCTRDFFRNMLGIEKYFIDYAL